MRRLNDYFKQILVVLLILLTSGIIASELSKTQHKTTDDRVVFKIKFNTKAEADKLKEIKLNENEKLSTKDLTLGKYKSYQEAKKRLVYLNDNGVSEARIKAYQNGEPLPVANSAKETADK